jgi:hypothetical protein
MEGMELGRKEERKGGVEEVVGTRKEPHLDWAEDMESLPITSPPTKTHEP